MQGTERFQVTRFLGTWNDKKFFEVRCKELHELLTMEVVARPSTTDTAVIQFGTVAESLPNWGLPFCMELRYVFETKYKRYYVLDYGGQKSLADLMNDGLPEPTVLILAAELVMALESLHELGVSYTELELSNVSVDNNGHVVLWREFEGKEYWHISECICGVLGVCCGKTGHKVKRRGSNLPPGQRQLGEISKGVQNDWKSLGILLCQLLTGRRGFKNFQSLEETIISLFITSNTKDFLYGLVTGTLNSFEDLKCHSCFQGMNWDEVKSKSLPSPLMANFRSRLHSAPSRPFSKSPSLQNVYTAGMSARLERGVLNPSLSRTHSTSDLHSYSNTKQTLSGFERGRSERRSTLGLSYHEAEQNRLNKERSTALTRNDSTTKPDRRNLQVYSQLVGVKSTSSLHRQVFGQNSRNFNRPPCLSAPTSPRHSVDTAQSYEFPPYNSAPSSPKGSDDTIYSGDGFNVPPTTTNGSFKQPETNPFHEEYKKRWGSATIDSAYGIYSSQLTQNNDNNNHSTIPGNVLDTNQSKNYGNCFSNSDGLTTRETVGTFIASQPNTLVFAHDSHSRIQVPNYGNIAKQRDELSVNTDQLTNDVFHYEYHTRHSSNAGVYKTDSTQNNRSTDGPYLQSNKFVSGSMPEQSLENTNNMNFATHPGIYVQNSQLLSENENIIRSNSSQKISSQHREHLPQYRPDKTGLDTTDGTQFLRSQSSTNISHLGNSLLSNSSFVPSNEQFQTRNVFSDELTSNDVNSSFFQGSSNNINGTIGQNTSKETASILFQKYFRSRRGSVDSAISGKVSPDFRNNEVNPTETPQIQITSRFNGRENSRFAKEEGTISQSIDETCSSSLQFNKKNLGFSKQNSRSPEPVVAVHPSSNKPVSDQLCEDADEFIRYQEQSQRRRSSTDVASLSSQQVATSNSVSSRRRMPLSRSASHSNLGEGFKNGRSSTEQSCHRRSMALTPIPSFEEFRTMRALNKMAYGNRNDCQAGQKDENNNCNDRIGNKSYNNNYNYDEKYNSSNGNNNNNNSNSSNNNNNLSKTTTSPASNPIIQDLLVKYGLDKSPPSSTNKLHQKCRSDTKKTDTPAAQTIDSRATTSDKTDTRQRLLNILDDFEAVRTKQKTLSTSSSMCNLKSGNSLHHIRRPSLPSDLIEENLNKSSDYSVADDKSHVKMEKGSHLKVFNSTDLENCEYSSIKKIDDKPGHGKPENFESPTLIISSPSYGDDYKTRNHKEKNSSNLTKIDSDSKEIEKNNRRKSKKNSTCLEDPSGIKQRENRPRSPNDQRPKVSHKESNPDLNNSDERMIPVTTEDKPKEREGRRRVSEKARQMARKHRESLELVKKSGKTARKERRKSFTQALQNKNNSTSEQDEFVTQGCGSGTVQTIADSRPIKGDHSLEIESTCVEHKDMRYQRLMNRRTSSLLSLTDDLSADLDEFDKEQAIPHSSESLSEFNEDYSNENHEISRGDSFLSVYTGFRNVFRTESSSSLLSRGSSFHSNVSADSGSVHLDFEDSEDDDDLFYPDELQGTPLKSEIDIQRNDSGLGEEIGVGTRVKKRWQDLGHVSTLQAKIVESWQEISARKDEKFNERQVEDTLEDKSEIDKKIVQQNQGRRVSRDRRISREKPPNAIDCPDCGRAFVVAKDKPSANSQGPKQTLICYKCQSHRVERKEAIIELVQTEINYGNDFQIIKEEFLSPMQTGGIISPDNLAKIFLNIQELLDVSTKFCKKIQSSMEACMNTNDEELCHMNVGKIFVENVELLQAYELYCSRQPEAISLLESLQKKNDVLRVFLNITCRENPKCRKMDINSFLLAPVQRVTKYPLLLSRIRRATPRWHGDREDLKLAQRKVEEQITKINSLTKSSEIKAKKFQSNLGTSNSVDSSRLKKLASDVLAWTVDEMQLLMHGQLKVQCSEFGGGQSWTKRATKKSIETHLLFCIRGQNEPVKVDSEEDDNLRFPNVSEISDASLLLLKRKSNGKYTLFRDEIKLRDCVAYDETEPDSFGLIHMGKESYVFTAKNSKDAKKWIKYLRLQACNQGKWRRRRNASANIMLKTS